MDLTKQSIAKHKSLILGIDGYLTVISKIENNTLTNPDIAIESCKSLIEGLCLKSLSLISDKYISSNSFQTRCKNDLKFLANTAFNEVYSNYVESQIHETLTNLIIDINVINKIKNKALKAVRDQTYESVGKISAIRNERGDISHGRNYPKKQESSISLSKSINSITDGICSFMIEELAVQYREKYKIANKLNYDELKDFNIWLDETHNILSVKIDFSKLLYDNSYDKYEEYFYLEYLSFPEIEEKEEPIEAIDEIVIYEKTIPEVIKEDGVKKSPNLTDEEAKELYDKVFNKKEEPIILKTLVNDFDKTSFWTETRIRKAKAFSNEQNLKESEFIELLNSYYEDDRLPARSDIANQIMITKPPLKEIESIVEPLKNRIIAFAQELNK